MVNYENICFVVMPFGKKKAGRRMIDFDSIFTSIFLPAIADVKLPGGALLEARRTDRDFFSGDITVEMFRYLEYSRFVLADITSLNANVFYELGVRHRARQSGTAIFRQVDVKLPFDISHIKAFPYEYKPKKNAQESRQLIAKVVGNSIVEDRTDNIIHLVTAQQQSRPQVNPQFNTEDVLHRAENALRRQDPATAIQLIREAVQADPNQILARVKLGILLKENGGQWQEALQLFREAVQASPDYADAWRELGIAQGKLGMAAEAQQSLHRAIELAPSDFDALASLGGILKKNGDLKVGLEMYRKSAQVSNGHSYPLLNALTLEAHLNGKLDLSGDSIALSRAERSLQAQVKDDPPYNAPWSLFDLAQIRLFQGDRDGFLQSLRRGVSFSTAAFMPETFRTTLELLPNDEQAFPGLKEGIEELRRAELQLRQTKAAAS